MTAICSHSEQLELENRALQVLPKHHDPVHSNIVATSTAGIL
jgi:hypothetical protein